MMGLQMNPLLGEESHAFGRDRQAAHETKLMVVAVAVVHQQCHGWGLLKCKAEYDIHT